jgi:hypothetical protein
MGWAWVIAVVVGLPLSYLIGPWRRRSAIEKRIASGSRTIADRTSVTVVGTIRVGANDLLQAPLSGRRGVIVYAHAELPEVDGRVGSTENVTLVTKRMQPFELDTDAGVVLVDGTELDLAIDPLRVPRRSAEREREFVTSHGRGDSVAAVATFRELVITPGMCIAVHGMAIIDTSEQGTERGYRDAPPARIRIVAPADSRIAIGAPRS